MSFLGSVLRDKTGKFSRRDDFAALDDAADDGYDFDETYDGLGDQLHETNDELNDETFGDVGNVGRDFDFGGGAPAQPVTSQPPQPPSQPAPPQQQEQTAFARQQVQEQRPAEQQRYVPQQSGWGSSVPLPGGPSGIWGSSAAQEPKRRPQTLEEIEAAMLQRSSPAPQQQQQQQQHLHQQPYPPQQRAPWPMQQQQQQGPFPGFAGQIGGFNQPPLGQSPGHGQRFPDAFVQRGFPGQPQGYPQPQHQQPLPPHQGQQQSQQQQQQPPIAPLQALAPAQQNVVAAAAPTTAVPPPGINSDPTPRNLRRAQKIGQMARYNGVMSNGDKNYVLKVQISQLFHEDPEADDFYFTVHSTLRGRSELQQGLGHFEQTYMARAGQNNRRRRNGNNNETNPLVKMQQQVQKIVQNAKSRPKSTSLAVEGSLGKLSFSRVRQPKQTLVVGKLADPVMQRQSKKEVLATIERAYNLLLKLEQVLRQQQQQQQAGEEGSNVTADADALVDELWSTLRIMDQVDASVEIHPFIQLLQHSKGKKLIPRLYRSLSEQRRLTLLTVVVAHLDMLDVVRLARHDATPQLSKELKDEVDLFHQTVLPPLLNYVSSAPLNIVAALLLMLLGRNHLELLLMSKVGLSFLTMFISRAELAKQQSLESGDGGGATAQDLAGWQSAYDGMFAKIEPKLTLIFPPPEPYTDEVYPWQFLASLALAASPDQQHAIVNEARDRVLDNVQNTKTLPPQIATLKRQNVNLFLNAIGLDASQLDG
ncbi:DNA topoisomerase 2-associated protein pat1 [Savitreella phatthalungensis]